MEIKGKFAIYDVNCLMEENLKLDGEYDIKIIRDERNDKDLDPNINCQTVFRKANVFFRKNTENVDELIMMFSEYTCKDIENVEKCNSASVQLKGGTICPTRKRLFRLKSKEFVAFGRYIFGYNANYVRIAKDGKVSEICEDSDEDAEEEDDYNKKKESSINEDEIILTVPPYGGSWEDDYIYSFMIFDYESGILDAFGLYR